MPRNSFLASVYRGVLESRAKIFSVCCNIRGAGKLRQKIFQVCFATQSGKHAGRERGAGRPFLPRHGGGPTFFAPPWGRADLFWGGPKKSPRSWLRCSALCPTSWHAHPRPLSRKWRGVNELEVPMATLDLTSWAQARRRGPTFFGWTPKKSPFFSAPKKPKKSPRSTRVGGAAIAPRVYFLGGCGSKTSKDDRTGPSSPGGFSGGVRLTDSSPIT
jgi:hypothetical protein